MTEQPNALVADDLPRSDALSISVQVTEDQPGTGALLLSNTPEWVDGAQLRLTGWEGWNDTPDVRADPVDLPGGDGAYDSDPLFAGRTIIVKGVVWAESASALSAVRKRFERLLAGKVRYGTVTVSENGEPARSCRARLGGKTTFAVTHPRRAEWSLSLYAAVPARVGASKTLSTRPYQPGGGLAFNWAFPWTFAGADGNAGTLVCVNDGEIDAAVVLDIAGACSNPSVTAIELGQRYALTADVQASLVIDTGTRTVVRDGAPAAGWMETQDSVMFKLPPGATTLFFQVSAGNPTFTVSWADTTP